MARQTIPVEFQTFNAGLITDASPLTSPDNSSLEEENFVLNKDGSRNRRQGMDFEANAQFHSAEFSRSSVDLQSILWRDASGSGIDILAVYTRDRIDFFNAGVHPISANLINSIGVSPFFSGEPSKEAQLAVVNGVLILVNSYTSIYVYEYDIDTNNVVVEEKTLKIRDLFGVEDIVVEWGKERDLFDGNNVSLRPVDSIVTNRHYYNLRNQGWGIPRPDGDDSVVRDPINIFNGYSFGWPSNSDTVLQAYYADPTDTTNPTLKKFFGEDLEKNPIGNVLSAKGYFIIDALRRGASRITEEIDNSFFKYSELTSLAQLYPVGDFEQDYTPTGASTVESFAGRAWFGGFSNEVIEPMDTSPRLGSYILFSQLVKSKNNVDRCYQENDPTSEFPDLLDTDGGFINISGADKIIGLKSAGKYLLVFATNGVWAVYGGNETGFTATRYSVDKVSDKGCVGQRTIVLVDNAVFYWAMDGIYVITPNQYGELVAQRISENKIQNLYNSISETSKNNCVGVYESFTRRIKWVYDNSFNTNQDTKELILDVVLQAFYTNRIFTNDCKTVSVSTSLNYQLFDDDENVTVGGVQVTVNGENVTVTSQLIEEDVFSDDIYLSIKDNGDGTFSYSFSRYNDVGFRDWRSIDNVGVDAAAFMVTSYMSGSDFQREKMVPYLTLHLRRTETGIDSGGSYINPSSCLVQARWDWSDAAVSNKWGRQFQAYRYKRLYLPQSLPDNFETGFLTIVTRHKLRGTGKVVSIKFSTEPDKDLHLYGWSMLFSLAGNV